MREKVLEGKVAIVTGAASPRGLGRAMTEALVRAGARVSMMDINQQWLDESSNYMREIGGDDWALENHVHANLWSCYRFNSVCVAWASRYFCRLFWINLNSPLSSKSTREA